MDAEREQWHKTLDRHEENLTNGKRNDPSAQNDAIVDMTRVVKLLVATDFVKLSDLKQHCSAVHKSRYVFNWPAVALVLPLAWRLLDYFLKIKNP